MIVLLYVLFALISVILVLMVLIQDEGGEGFGGIFGGGSTTPFGSRSGNVLTRFTSILAALFLFICVGLGLLNKSPEIESSVNLGNQAETPDPLIPTEDYTVQEGAGQTAPVSPGLLSPLSPNDVVNKAIESEKQGSQ
jgi:preprotein translocase subunit SecG